MDKLREITSNLIGCCSERVKLEHLIAVDGGLAMLIMLLGNPNVVKPTWWFILIYFLWATVTSLIALAFCRMHGYPYIFGPVACCLLCTTAILSATGPPPGVAPAFVPVGTCLGALVYSGLAHLLKVLGNYFSTNHQRSANGHRDPEAGQSGQEQPDNVESQPHHGHIPGEGIH